MADNVAITAGTGTSVATDDVGGVHFQRMKLVDGTADSSEAIPGDATHGLDVDVTRSALPTGASTLAKQDSILAELQLKADLTETQPVSLASVPSHAVTNEGTFAVQPTTADGADTTMGAKADAKSTATDTTPISVVSILKQISASVQAPPSHAVSGTVTANAGTDLNTSALALESGGNLASIKAKTDNIPALGQALASASVPVILPSATITTLTPPAAITGFATSAKQDTLDTSINTLLKPASTLAGVTTVTTVSAVTAITNALPAGTNAIGKLTANSGVDIGDVTLNAGTDSIGKLLPPDIDVTAHTNYARKYYTNAGAVTDGIIWSPASGKRWHVVTLYLQVSAVATVTLEDDKAGGDDPVWKGELAANSGVVLSFTEKYPMASGEDAADLLITTTAGNVYVTTVGYEI